MYAVPAGKRTLSCHWLIGVSPGFTFQGGLILVACRSFSSQYLECSSHWQDGHQTCFPGKYWYWLYLTHLLNPDQGLLGLLAAEGHSVIQETSRVSIPIRCLPQRLPGRSPECLGAKQSLWVIEFLRFFREVFNVNDTLCHRDKVLPSHNHTPDGSHWACQGTMPREMGKGVLYRTLEGQRLAKGWTCLPPASSYPFNPLCATDLQRATSRMFSPIR